MKGKVWKMIAGVAFAAMLITIFESSAANAEEAVGKVTRVQGNVNVIRGGKPLKAGIGTRIMAGDIIQTEENGRVKILMNDSTILGLGSKSQFRIKNYRHDTRARQTTADYSLVYGRGRAVVPRGAGTRNINFSTPSAVAGVRGTELIMEYDPVTGQTKFVVGDGTVTVADPNDPTRTITLTAGMGCIVGPDGVPGAPFNVTPEEIEELRKQAQSDEGAPRRVVVMELPGQTAVLTVDTGGGEQEIIIITDTGTVINPQDLIDQEPPLLTPVKVNLNLGGGAAKGP